MDRLIIRPSNRGFLLPIVLLTLLLAGLVAISTLASSAVGAQTQQAALLRRLAFEAAEDALALAVRSGPSRTAPWSTTTITGTGMRVVLTVTPLGDWPSAAATTGQPLLERHERADAVASASGGALAHLQQDYAYLPVATQSLALPAQRSVWRSLEAPP